MHKVRNVSEIDAQAHDSAKDKTRGCNEETAGAKLHFPPALSLLPRTQLATMGILQSR